MRQIRVAFDRVVAVDEVDLTLRPGERHAVVGENGAGKSTLMRVLFGLQSPDSGEILLDGQPACFRSPADAMAAGIGMVQQHFELIDAFTVAENILLGAETPAVRGGRFDTRAAASTVTALSESHGLPVPADVPVGDLSVAARQRVEILKALYRNARILILDEPTAVLSPSEARDLWNSVARLAGSGKTVVFVTHKLEDVMQNADRVTVLRQGKRALSVRTEETSVRDLAKAMLGSDTIRTVEGVASLPTEAGPNARTVLDLSGVTVRDAAGVPRVREASLQVRAGEILGVAGVDGSGQEALLEAIMGLLPVASGRISLDEADITHLATSERRHRGLGYIPADRHRQAIVPSLSCEENSILGEQQDERFSFHGCLLRMPALRSFLSERAQEFDVRGARPGTPLWALSGGNQQKLVLARELFRKPRLLIAAQPTRGLDFAATAFVHKTLVSERERGCAILLQSLDLSEIMALSDRVAVMRDGRIVGLLERPQATLDNIGRLMTGATEASVA